MFSAGTLGSMVYKRAQDFTVGDYLYVNSAASGKQSLQPVTGASLVIKNLSWQTWAYMGIAANVLLQGG